MFVSVSAPDTIPKGLIGTTIVRVGALVGARVFAEVGGGVGARVFAEVGGVVGARVLVEVGGGVGARVFAEVGGGVGARVILTEVGGGVGARVLTEVGGRVGARSLQMSAEESAKLCSSSVSACCSYPSTSTLSLSLVSLFLISFPQMTCSSSTSFRGIEAHVDCVCFLGWLLPMDSSSIQFPLEMKLMTHRCCCLLFL